MQSCPNCGKSYDNSITICDCGYDFYQQKLNKKTALRPTGAKQTADSKTALSRAVVGCSTVYTSTYGTTRSIAKLVSFFGWVLIIIGFPISLFFILESLRSQKDYTTFQLFLDLLPALSGLYSGLLLVISGQLTRATVDTADNTGKMFALMTLKQGN